MLILLDAIISLTLRIADIVSTIFDIEVAGQHPKDRNTSPERKVKADLIRQASHFPP